MTPRVLAEEGGGRGEEEDEEGEEEEEKEGRGEEEKEGGGGGGGGEEENNTDLAYLASIFVIHLYTLFAVYNAAIMCYSTEYRAKTIFDSRNEN